MPTTPTDPLYAQQWNLAALGDLPTIWDDYDGAGVHVGLYSTGIQYTHPDLAPNYDPSLHLSDGTTVADGYDNGWGASAGVGAAGGGTAIAGVIAAAADGVGTVGVAYAAKLTGINVFSLPSQWANDAPFFSSFDDFDVSIFDAFLGATAFSASANPNVFDSAASTYLEYQGIAADQGRGGLGTILLWVSSSSVPSGLGLLNDIRAMVVGAVTQASAPITPGAYGENLFVVAGSGSTGSGPITTDLTGTPGRNLTSNPTVPSDYSDGYGRAGIAAGAVAGVTALMLDANAGLGWRDVQDIIAMSATRTGGAYGAAPGTWEWGSWRFNGADNWNNGGLHNHVSYGFGQINAYNAVRMAEVWSLFGAAKTSETLTSLQGSVAVNQSYAAATLTPISFEMPAGVDIESLQLTIGLTTSQFSMMQLQLVAPSGETYQLLKLTGGQPNGAASGGLTWTFGVTGVRGAASQGIWQLKISNGFAAYTVGSVKLALFGADASSDDVYHYTSEFADVLAVDASRGTLTDTNGGTDWIDMAAMPGDVDLTLEANADQRYNGSSLFQIGADTLIENAVTGDGNDEIFGNDAANHLLGMRGNDAILGLGGNDRIEGGAGNDFLSGGLGDDVVDAGDGMDSISDEGGNDVLRGGDGSDSLRYQGASAAVQVSLAITGAQNTRGAGTDTISGFEQLYGSAFNDRLTGSDQNNVVGGNAGDDTIDGRAGHDDLYGDAGNDTLYARADGDILDGGADIDTVSYLYAAHAITASLMLEWQDASAGYDRFFNLENLTGSAYADTLIGNDGANSLNGGKGADSMSGGAGNDRYVVDDVGDTVIELEGDGTDTISSSVDFSLAGGFVENLTLTGVAISATGNSLANLLVGNARGNILDGDTGADEMRGAKGDDVYFVDSTLDRVIEFDGEGSDLVNSSVTYSLAGQYIEVLNLTGSAAINGTGNGLANRIVGNSAVNVLTGGDGNDRLDGGAGGDTLRGGLGNDTFVVDDAADKIVENNNEGTDTVEAWINFSLAAQYIETLKLMGTANLTAAGNGQANTLIGNSGDNLLDGKGGADTMRGDAGNDRYLVDDSADKVFEIAGEGYDVVQTTVSFSIVGQYVEDMVLLGTAAINGTGNGLANVLYGNSAANVLRGEGGSDALKGGLGTDTLSGGAGSDQFWFDSALGLNNIDTVTDFNLVDDVIILDRTIFTGIATDGTLSAEAFRIGTVALDADDRILYDAATGNFWYDRDGVGGVAAVQFAKLSAGLALDFSHVIALP